MLGGQDGGHEGRIAAQGDAEGGKRLEQIHTDTPARPSSSHGWTLVKLMKLMRLEHTHTFIYKDTQSKVQPYKNRPGHSL